jgi:hypothetical protein
VARARAVIVIVRNMKIDVTIDSEIIAVPTKLGGRRELRVYAPGPGSCAPSA